VGERFFDAAGRLCDARGIERGAIAMRLLYVGEVHRFVTYARRHDVVSDRNDDIIPRSAREVRNFIGVKNLLRVDLPSPSGHEEERANEDPLGSSQGQTNLKRDSKMITGLLKRIECWIISLTGE
jgi:hypothetical protein